MAKVEYVSHSTPILHPAMELDGVDPSVLGGRAGEWNEFLVTIQYDLGPNTGCLSHLLNVVAGEVHHVGYVGSIKVMELDAHAGSGVARGPGLGEAGLRDLLGIREDRPILIVPTKPSIGLHIVELCSRNLLALRGGADIVKDDELAPTLSERVGLQRIEAMCSVLEEVERVTGERKMYILNIFSALHTSERLRARIAALRRQGVLLGVMVCPGLTSLCSIEDIAEWARAEAVPLFSHNAGFTMSSRHARFGVAFNVFVTLQRFAGSDAAVMPAPFGNFVMAEEEALLNMTACRSKGLIKSTLPALAGKRLPRNVFQTLDLCGRNVGLIAGTGVYSHPDGPEAGAASLRQAIDAYEEEIPLETFARDRVELRRSLEHFV